MSSSSKDDPRPARFDEDDQDFGDRQGDGMDLDGIFIETADGGHASAREHLMDADDEQGQQTQEQE